jgi:hypothetical protein
MATQIEQPGRVFVSPPSIHKHVLGETSSSRRVTMSWTWAEGRALLRSNSSAVPGANTEWGGTMPPSSIRDWHQCDKSLSAHPGASSLHAAAMARHSENVMRFFSMCQMIVVSFRITATRAIVAPRRRLTRLNHSRSRASFRSTLCVT